MVLIVVLTLALFVGGLALRIRIENLVAYVLGPMILLTMLVALQDAFELAPSPSDRDGFRVIEVEDDTDTASGWLPLFAALLIPLLVVVVFSTGGLLIRRSVRWLDARVFTPVEEAVYSTGAAGTSDQIQLYFSTAAKLAALMAAADGLAQHEEYAAFQASFDIGALNEPLVARAFSQQLKHPQSLQLILRPYVFRFGLGNPLSETLVFGMAKVALADGKVAAPEQRIIGEICDYLCIGRDTASRILESAGMAFSETWRAGGDRTSNSQSPPRDFEHGLSERERHLRLLGLKPGATLQDVKTARRRLAKKYHPDRLMAKGLPESELEKAEAMMVKVNAACDWFEAHGV